MPSPNNSPSATPKSSTDSDEDMDDTTRSSDSDHSENDAKSRKKKKSKKKSKKKKKKKSKSSKKIKQEYGTNHSSSNDALNTSVSVDDALLSIQILSEQIAQIKQLAQQRNVSLEHPDIKNYLERLNRLKMFARQKIDANDKGKRSKSVKYIYI